MAILIYFLLSQCYNQPCLVRNKEIFLKMALEYRDIRALNVPYIKATLQKFFVRIIAQKYFELFYELFATLAAAVRE